MAIYCGTVVVIALIVSVPLATWSCIVGLWWWWWLPWLSLSPLTHGMAVCSGDFIMIAFFGSFCCFDVVRSEPQVTHQTIYTIIAWPREQGQRVNNTLTSSLTTNGKYHLKFGAQSFADVISVIIWHTEWLDTNAISWYTTRPRIYTSVPWCNEWSDINLPTLFKLACLLTPLTRRWLLEMEQALDFLTFLLDDRSFHYIKKTPFGRLIAHLFVLS